MTSVQVTLPDALKAYVEEQVMQGGYGTVSEFTQALIRADRERKAEEQLEEFVLEGLESGDAVPVTPNFWQDLWWNVDAKKQKNLSNAPPLAADALKQTAV